MPSSGQPAAALPPPGLRDDAPVPRRWTLHGLNTGLIFAATRAGVRWLPRRAAYALGDAGTWIAAQAMHRTRAAVAANLEPLFPGAAPGALDARARATFRSYAHDTIDFLRALREEPDVGRLFDMRPEHRRVFEETAARGRGMLLVTGHYGNWEIGSLLVRRALGLPLTIVAMADASAGVNRIRRELRESLGAETLEVRRSLDTALQIRRRLAGNHVVAMLVDRHYGRDRVAVQLLGRHAWFLRTPFVMAHATGAPIVPCFIERVGPGRFAPRPGSPIQLAPDAPREEAIGAAARQVADVLGSRIRQRPELWYQFYRYWDAQRDTYDGLA